MTNSHKSVISDFQMKSISDQPLINQNSNNRGKNNDDINNLAGTEPTQPSTDNLQKDDNELPSPLNSKQDILEKFMGDSDDDTLKAFNLYRNKKLLTQSMMDIALFSANASQLRNVLDVNDKNIISTICVILLLISISLQITVGVTLLLSTRYNVTNCEERKMAFKFGNYVIVGIFLITVVNVLITAFGGPHGTGN